MATERVGGEGAGRWVGRSFLERKVGRHPCVPLRAFLKAMVGI